MTFQFRKSHRVFSLQSWLFKSLSPSENNDPQLQSSAKVPNSLLILTRTKTDSQGRRHSVAVPLLQSEEGARPDSGFLVERKVSGAGQDSRLRGRRHSLQPISRSPMRRQGSRRASSRRPSKQGV